MNDSQSHQDPYTNKDFWVRHLSTKTRMELERGSLDFDDLRLEFEKEFRIVMTPSRVEACRQALLELLGYESGQAKDLNQGELFNLS